METWTCYRCGTSFTRYRSQVKNPEKPYCTKACANRQRWADHAKPPGDYTLVRRPDHPLTPPSGAVGEHRLILYDRLGPGPQRCHHCGTEVIWNPVTITGPDALVVDHLNGDPRDNSEGNLVPSCHTCNVRRRHDHIRDDEVFYTFPTGKRVRGVIRICEHCEATFVAVAAQARTPGKARFCSRSCARSKPRSRS